MVTVIIPCWKRFKNVEKVIRGWLDQKEVDQVIVWDNSGNFKTDLSVLVLNSNQNLGPQAKYVCGQFAKNELILFSDDDVIAKGNLIGDLSRVKNGDMNKVVGIMGRNFTGENYYGSTFCQGNVIEYSVKVDYLCGLVMLASCEHCFVDICKCPSILMDDWWWQHEIGVSLYVAPTKNYELLPESGDKYALHLKPELKEIREEYYRKWVKNDNL
jgi:hypothetical protein